VIVSVETQPDKSTEEPTPPDSVLIQRALAGNQKAFEALVNRYQHSLFALVYHYVGEHHEAQDILQQVWLQLYLSLGTLRPQVSIKPWLITVARNRSLDALRHKRLPSFSEVETGNVEHEAVSIDEIPDTSPTPEEQAERRDLQQAIHCAIQTIPHAYRWVVLLHYGEQLTFSPDWTHPSHTKISCQDPIQSSQTVATRSLHFADADDEFSCVRLSRYKDQCVNALDSMMKEEPRQSCDFPRLLTRVEAVCRRST
jgi:RNA polymerase sigma factor (sigma-70 family)